MQIYSICILKYYLSHFHLFTLFNYDPFLNLQVWYASTPVNRLFVLIDESIDCN